MTIALWAEFPDRYRRCDRCAGSGRIDCRCCAGMGSVVGPDHYLIGRTIGRRFGLKCCPTCHGSGKWRCGMCTSGSVPRSGPG